MIFSMNNYSRDRDRNDNYDKYDKSKGISKLSCTTLQVTCVVIPNFRLVLHWNLSKSKMLNIESLEPQSINLTNRTLHCTVDNWLDIIHYEY